MVSVACAALKGFPFAFLIAVLTAGPAHGAFFTIQDLGTLGGTLSKGFGINDSGQTVGSASSNGILNSYAFRTTSNGKINAAAALV